MNSDSDLGTYCLYLVIMPLLAGALIFGGDSIADYGASLSGSGSGFFQTLGILLIITGIIIGAIWFFPLFFDALRSFVGSTKGFFPILGFLLIVAAVIIGVMWFFPQLPGLFPDFFG